MKKSNGIKKVINNKKAQKLEKKIGVLKVQGWYTDNHYVCKEAAEKGRIVYGMIHPRRAGIIFCPYPNCAMEITDLQGHFHMGSDFLKKKKIA